MSVSLIISSPQNKDEEAFYIPLSSERVFRDCWMPIIEALDLKWARCFQSGIEIEYEDLIPVIDDLKSILTWINNHEDYEQREQMIERINSLCTGLKEIFNEKGSKIKVYIG